MIDLRQASQHGFEIDGRYFRSASGVVDHLGELHVGDVARFGSLACAKAYSLVLEHIARTGTFRVAYAMPEFDGTLHNATTFSQIDLHVSVFPRPGAS